MKRTIVLCLISLIAGAAIVYVRVQSISDAEIDRLKAEIEQLTVQAESLQVEVELAENKRKAALERALEVETRERNLQRQLRVEQTQHEQQIARLRRQRVSNEERLKAEISDLRTLSNDDLSTYCVTMLGTLYKTNMFAGTLQEDYRVDRRFMEITGEAATEVGNLRANEILLHSELEATQQLVTSKQTQIESLGREKTTLTTRCETCEAALDAQKVLEENQQERLKLQAEEIQKWEAKMRKEKLKRIGWSIGSAAVGFGVGKVIN